MSAISTMTSSQIFNSGAHMDKIKPIGAKGVIHFNPALNARAARQPYLNNSLPLDSGASDLGVNSLH